MSKTMDKPLTNDFNALTNEYLSREMNDNELAQYEADNAKAATVKKEKEAAAKIKAENKATALTKLAALGLTEEEVSLILG